MTLITRLKKRPRAVLGLFLGTVLSVMVHFDLVLFEFLLIANRTVK